jgi:hypothetical protein
VRRGLVSTAAVVCCLLQYAVAAVPNKLVAELVVFNRTRSLTGVPRAEAAAVAAAAPLRRVLCFNIQLDRWAAAELCVFCVVDAAQTGVLCGEAWLAKQQPFVVCSKMLLWLCLTSWWPS